MLLTMVLVKAYKVAPPCPLRTSYSLFSSNSSTNWYGLLPQVTPPLAIFGAAALCLGLFFLDVPGIRPQDNWCHVPRYGDFSTQEAGYRAKCVGAG